MTTIVHCKNDRYDIYIGRRKNGPHFGNPFSHLLWAVQNGLAKVLVSNRDEAIKCFKAWLLGETHQDLEQQRRQYILDHLHELKGQALGCFCSPLSCHGDVLKELADGR
jgi:hypothetical protein